MFANPITISGSNAAFVQGAQLLCWGKSQALSVMLMHGNMLQPRVHPVAGRCIQVAPARRAPFWAAVNDKNLVMILDGRPDWSPCMPVHFLASPGATAVAITHDGSVVATGDDTGLVRMWHRMGLPNKPYSRHVSLRGITSMDFDSRGWLYACDVRGHAFLLAGYTLTPYARFSAEREVLLELHEGDNDGLLPADFEAYSISAQPDGDHVLLSGTGGAYLLKVAANNTTISEGDEWQRPAALQVVSALPLAIQGGGDVRRGEFVDQSTVVLYGESCLQTWRINPVSGETVGAQHYQHANMRPLAAVLQQGPMGEELTIALAL